MINIFTYTDYRLFLRDLFEESKKENRRITQKAVLEKMGVSSTGFFSNVIAGKKNLTLSQVKKICEILKLKKAQQRYLEYLVLYAKTKSIEDKKEYFDRVISLQKIKMKVLDKKQVGVFAQWYYVFIRELLNFYKFKDDYKELAQMLDPPIKPAEAEQAIKDLSELGLISKGADGYYRQTDSILTTGNEVQSLQLANFQLNTMDMAKRALQKIRAKERDISVLTISLSRDCFSLVKSEIQEFRKKLLKIAYNDQKTDTVYQCNIQFFPVSKTAPENQIPDITEDKNATL